MKAMRHLVLILILAAAAGCGRGSRPVAAREACMSNLGMLNGATALWSLENRKTTNDVPAMADLAKYLKTVPQCPSGGTYTLGTSARFPKCSIPGHELPATNQPSIKL